MKLFRPLAVFLALLVFALVPADAGKLVNRAMMTVSGTPGTGTITLGGAVSGFQTFAAAGVANGDVVSYTIEDGTSWEYGQGTYTSAGTTLARTTVQGSSAGGTTAISATANARVFASALAADIDTPSGANTLTNKTIDTAGPNTLKVGGVTLSTGQYPGTATNDNATAGNVGQIVFASTAETGGAQGGNSGATITIASPAVITYPITIPYGFSGTGCAAIYFNTNGALPTGIVANTNYYVINSSISGNTFQIATSCDNAIAGTAVNTSGTQSGIHSIFPRASLTSNATTNVVGISLPAGDWDVTTDIAYFSGATTSITLLALGSSTVSATYQSNPGQAFQYVVPAQVPGAGNIIFHAGPRRYSLSSTTTIYGVALPTFTVSTEDAWGGIRARRVR